MSFGNMSSINVTAAASEEFVYLKGPKIKWFLYTGYKALDPVLYTQNSWIIYLPAHDM
jgi:hypothetical protein